MEVDIFVRLHERPAVSVEIVDVTRWQDTDNGIDMVLEPSLSLRYCYFDKCDAERELLSRRKNNRTRAFVLLEAVAFAEDGRSWQEVHIEPITE